MPTTYAPPLPTDGVLPLLAHAMERWHERLHKAKVRVCVLWAANEDGPPLKHGQYPAVAKLKILSLKERVRSRLDDAEGYDAELLIDETEYRALENDARAALLDQALERLDVVEKEVEGRRVLQRDDIGRPKLKLVRGDLFGGDGFTAVIVRHGPAALEYQNAQRMNEQTEAAAREANPSRR